MTSRLLFTFLVSAIAFGCTSVADDDGSVSTEDEYKVKPKGPDVNGGGVRVVAPSLPAGTTLLPAKFTVDLDTSNVATPVGQTRSGFGRVGRTFVRIAGDDGTASVHIDSYEEIKAATVASVDLAGLRVMHGTGVEPLGFPKRKIHLTANTGGMTVLEVPPTATGKTVLPVLPASFAFEWGVYDGFDVITTAGTTTTVDLTSRAGRRTAKIIPPTRELPDGCPSGKGFRVWAKEIIPIQVSPFDSSVDIGQNEAIVARHGQLPGIIIDLPCGGIGNVPLSAPGASPAQFQIGRVDIDDVEVALTNGSKEMRKGTYVVYRPGTHEALFSPLPTGTGVDLLPGTYELVVQYKTSAGTYGRYEETITTP
jgi:hypothetical protein